MMELFLKPDTWIALATLTFLEIILGVDNIIFISIVSNKLPEEQSGKARTIGLLAALGLRIALLLGISYIVGFTQPLISFDIFSHHFDFSGRDLILFVGGLFLLAKSTTEISHKMEGQNGSDDQTKKVVSMGAIIGQIILMDLIFSFDSILTAVGLTDHVILMIIAVVLSLMVMIAFSGKISRFISKHPSLEILALSFLILIGFMLVVEGLHVHVPKGYIYFALFFSLGVEALNMRFRKKRAPVKLNKRISEEDTDQ